MVFNLFLREELKLMSAADGCSGGGTVVEGSRSEEIGNTASQMLSMGLVQLPKSKYKDLLKGALHSAENKNGGTSCSYLKIILRGNS